MVAAVFKCRRLRWQRLSSRKCLITGISDKSGTECVHFLSYLAKGGCLYLIFFPSYFFFFYVSVLFLWLEPQWRTISDPNIENHMTFLCVFFSDCEIKKLLGFLCEMLRAQRVKSSISGSLTGKLYNSRHRPGSER